MTLDPLTLNEYQAVAKTTARYPTPPGMTLGYPILGLAGEAGELANCYKKVLRDDQGKLSDEKAKQLALELGDCLWYVAAVAGDLGLSLEDVARRNLDKLLGRTQRGTIQGQGEGR